MAAGSAFCEREIETVTSVVEDVNAAGHRSVATSFRGEKGIHLGADSREFLVGSNHTAANESCIGYPDGDTGRESVDPIA